MFRRYEVTVYYEDDLIYLKTFKSFNNALKVCAGFDDSSYIEITDRIFDKIIPNCEVKMFIKELISDCEDY